MCGCPGATGRLHTWVSDIDAEFHEADERMRMLVSGISSAGPAVSGQVGDEDPLEVVALTPSWSSRPMR